VLEQASFVTATAPATAARAHETKHGPRRSMEQKVKIRLVVYFAVNRCEQRSLGRRVEWIVPRSKIALRAINRIIERNNSKQRQCAQNALRSASPRFAQR